MYNAFVECVDGLYLSNRELCPDDYLWRSLREYSWYIREQMAGFDPEQCKGKISLSIHCVQLALAAQSDAHFTLDHVILLILILLH